MMKRYESDPESALARDAATALTPIVRALVGDGVGAGQAASIVRRLFVLEARANITASGKRVTVAAISAITGLTRWEVRQHLTNSSLQQPWHESRLSRVLVGWRTDPEFLDDSGQPAQLPYTAKRRSFGHSEEHGIAAC